MQKAVVTGGAGFIGSHIAEGLLERDYRVAVIDDLSTCKLENISHIMSNSNLEFIRGSIMDKNLLFKAFENTDYVFHQAAIASVSRSIENPILSNDVNTTGTLNVLVAAKENNVKKVVYASSSAVYGDTPILSKREDMTPNPQSPYAVSKLTAEYYCLVFHKIYGLPTASLRYFNVYGPRQDPDSQYSAVIPLFVKAICAGKPPVIFGDGEQTRDFVYVKDVAMANIMAAEGDAGGIFNIGSGESISLNKLSSLLLKLMKRTDIEPVYKAERAGDIKHSLADITKVVSFGFKPSYSLEAGFKETIKGNTCHCEEGAVGD